jgi:serine/threonine-protein kinase RsbW
MSDQTWNWTTEEVFESRLGAGAAFITLVTERLVEFGWSDGDVYAVRLALEEGITNAIRHGNQLDPNKQVTANCRLAAKRVWIEILDEGHGFDPERVPDPTEPENLERPGGRGLLLMRSYMTRVEYSPRGNHLVMEKHLTQ